MHDVVLTGGWVVDPSNNIDGPAAIAARDGRISEVGRLTTVGRRVINATDLHVLPGVMDTHTHLSRHFGSAKGHAMVAQTGVVTALDLAGSFDDLAEALTGAGAGLNVAFLHPLIPGRTVSAPDAPRRGNRCGDRRSLDRRRHWVKVLGGHYPLTPEATERAITAASSRGCYLAFHVGTTATGSDIRSLAEALDLTGSRPIHVAHVNSYCRGQEAGDPVAEAQRALDTSAPGRCATSSSSRASTLPACCASGPKGTWAWAPTRT